MSVVTGARKNGFCREWHGTGSDIGRVISVK